MDSRSREKVIRVSLRYGSNSNSALVRELRKRPPYERAKYIRQLTDEAFRARRSERPVYGGPPSPRPDLGK